MAEKIKIINCEDFGFFSAKLFVNDDIYFDNIESKGNFEIELKKDETTIYVSYFLSKSNKITIKKGEVGEDSSIRISYKPFGREFNFKQSVSDNLIESLDSFLLSFSKEKRIQLQLQNTKSKDWSK